MYDWLIANGATILIGSVLLGVLVAIVVSLIRKKKRGETSCGCGCSGCAMKELCHSAKKSETES